MRFDHRHLTVKAMGLGRPSMTEERLADWLRAVVRAVGMKVLAGPFPVRCDTPGNLGITGVVVIETSHCAIHVWEAPDAGPHGPYLTFCLYSCAWFGTGDVVRMVAAEFGAEHVTWTLLDRNGDHSEVVEEGEWRAASPAVLGAFEL